MSQPIKITEAEFSEIRTLQSKFQDIVLKMGYLGLEKIDLDRVVNEFVEKEGKIKEELSAFQKAENTLLDKLIKTYGEGNLNMADGTFTPTSPPKQ